MNITERELDQLKEAKNEAEWNEAVDKMLEIRGGKYPTDWYEKVLSANLELQPGIDLDIHFIPFKP